MKCNNEYTNLIDKLDTTEEFKNELIKKIKEKELKKGLLKMKIKNKIVAIITALGILTCSGIVYASIVPEEIKVAINNKISLFLGIEIDNNEDVEYSLGIQEETLNQIFESDKENLNEYSQLTDPDTYNIGDSREGTILESNYKQYDWNLEYDEDGNIIEKTIEKYNDIINIKLGKVNYTCIEKLDNENTVIDNEGNVIERKESNIEEILEYQNNEFRTNWNDYYYGMNDNKEKLFFEITGMLIMNGNNLTEKDYYANARAKKIKIIFDKKNEIIINLEDKKDVQFFELEHIHYDISKPVDITVEILEVYDGNISDDIYISDIQFGISSNIPRGI